MSKRHVMDERALEARLENGAVLWEATPWEDLVLNMVGAKKPHERSTPSSV